MSVINIMDLIFELDDVVAKLYMQNLVPKRLPFLKGLTKTKQSHRKSLVVILRFPIYYLSFQIQNAFYANYLTWLKNKQKKMWNSKLMNPSYII